MRSPVAQLGSKRRKETLCCVFEQDNLSSASTGSTQEDRKVSRDD